MDLGELKRRSAAAWLIVSSPLGLVAVIVLVLIGWLSVEVVRGSVRASQLSRDLSQTEEALIEAKGAVVAERASQRALLDEADRLQVELGILTQKLGEKPAVREVIKWKTEEVEVFKGVPSVPAPGCSDDASPRGFDCPPVRIKTSGVTASFETRSGTVAVLGQVKLTRTSPLPEESFLVPFSVETEAFAAPAAPVPPRWYVGPAAAIADGKAAFGAAAIGPPVRVWKVEARPVFGALMDSEGHATASVALTFGIGR